MSNAVRKVIFWLSVTVFSCSLAAILYFFVIQPIVNNIKNNYARSIYYGPDDSERFSALQEINKDIIGWIKINDTPIDYPVLKPSDDEDDEYYLYRNYKRENSRYGSIFISPQTYTPENSKNIIMHGHSMRDGSMFASIIEFKNLDYYKARPTFRFDTLDGNARWKIFSVFSTNTLSIHGPVFNFTKYKFSDGNDFMAFVKELFDRSLINIPVDVNENDNLLTLSTCSYEAEDFRTVVVARKVRENEDPNVDVDIAEKNPNPVLPEVLR